MDASLCQMLSHQGPCLKALDLWLSCVSSPSGECTHTAQAKGPQAGVSPALTWDSRAHLHRLFSSYGLWTLLVTIPHADVSNTGVRAVLTT